MNYICIYDLSILDTENIIFRWSSHNTNLTDRSHFGGDGVRFSPYIAVVFQIFSTSFGYSCTTWQQIIRSLDIAL